MYKKYFLVTACILHTYAFAMDTKSVASLVNGLNGNKQTPLHIATMTPEERKSLSPNIPVPQEELSVYDLKNAQMAACLILAGAKVDIPDKWSQTPYDRAKQNEDRLPKVCAVVTAGLIIQNQVALLQRYMDSISD